MKSASSQENPKQTYRELLEALKLLPKSRPSKSSQSVENGGNLIDRLTSEISGLVAERISDQIAAEIPGIIERVARDTVKEFFITVRATPSEVADSAAAFVRGVFNR